MREALMILPHSATCTAFLHEQLQDELVRRFGGYTVYPANGAWWNAKDWRIEKEPSAAYVVAMDTTPENAKAWLDIARTYGAMGHQRAVYVRDLWGNVALVPVCEQSALDLPDLRRVEENSAA